MIAYRTILLGMARLGAARRSAMGARRDSCLCTLHPVICSTDKEHRVGFGVKLLLINPNTTNSMTRKVESAAKAVAGPEKEIIATNPPDGPASIQGYLDGAACPAWLVRLRDEQEAPWEQVRAVGDQPRATLSARAMLVHADALDWLSALPAESLHAVVTDPPYGLIEYEDEQQAKVRCGRGGVWRIPPSFDGAKRRPLPRFTVLSEIEVKALGDFFARVAAELARVLVPGGHCFVASNPLLSSLTFHACQQSGLEKRGDIIRLVQTLRGGDRPKGAEREFSQVSMMPRSCWEPWGIFRRPLIGTGAENLRRYGTGGLRRPTPDGPLKDVIPCPPTRGPERALAPHPSLKPQRLLRQLVRAALPLGVGIIYDPFAGRQIESKSERRDALRFPAPRSCLLSLAFGQSCNSG